MNKEFIPYEQALALKELGFDEPCFGCYDEKGVFGLTVMSIKQYYTNSKEDTWNCSAPLYQQAFRWFREKHGICSWIQRLYNEYGNPYYTIIHEYKTDLLSRNHTVVANLKEYNTYEEAEQACLDKLIQLVKNE
jgi:hypothetical protein